jgi:hypothetical protein
VGGYFVGKINLVGIYGCHVRVGYNDLISTEHCGDEANHFLE